jgi:hypothetical protein
VRLGENWSLAFVGREADFSTAAASAPPPVEMTVSF